MKAADLKKSLHEAINKVDDKLLEARFSELMSLKQSRPAAAKKALLALLEDLLNLHHNLAYGYKEEALVNEDMTRYGKPMTKEQFRKRIQDAQESVKKGNFTSHEDLENESRSW